MMNKKMVGLQSVLVQEPADCGVYLGYGSRNLITVVLDVLARQTRSSVDSVAPAPRPIIWIDAGNSFDPYAMAQAARRRGWNPQSVLKAIQVARPFTAFQLPEILAKVPHSAVPPLVIVSDIMGLFYDGGLQPADLERAFRLFKLRLADLGRCAMVIGLVFHRTAPASRTHLLPQVLGLARRVFMPSCTARPNMAVPVKRAVALACSLLVLGGAAVIKKAVQLWLCTVVYWGAVRG